MTPLDDDADGPGRERPGHDERGHDERGRDEPGRERLTRAELERQIHGHRRSWRDQPKGLGCLVIFGFMVLTTIAFAIGLALLLGAVR